MIINELNGEVINTRDVYIHDDILLELKFDRIKRNLTLNFQNYANDFTYVIEFLNVIGFEMTSCDFWGASECALGFEYVPKDERVLVPKLQEEWTNLPNSLDIPSYEDSIETLLTFGSGDRLRIACETINFLK